MVRTTDQDESTEVQPKEFRQPEPMLVLAKWLGPGELCTAADILSSTFDSLTSTTVVYLYFVNPHTST